MIRDIALACLLSLGVNVNARSAAPVDYARDVQPILALNCVGCHGPQKAKSGIRVDSPAELANSGTIVRGNSANSSLFLCLNGAEGVKQMPPKNRLTADQMTTIKNWIDQGARANAAEKPNAAVANAQPAKPAAVNAKPVENANERQKDAVEKARERQKDVMEKARERQKDAMEKARERQKDVMEKARERRNKEKDD